MFDPNFSGQVPPIDTITATFHTFGHTEPEPGVHQLTVDALITALTGPADGFAADTRFVFVLAEQPDGYLRIREIREVEKLGPVPRAASAAESSWAGIKALYRTAP